MNFRTRSRSDTSCPVNFREVVGGAGIIYSLLLLSCSEVFWKGSGPLLFYTGNEGAIEGFYDNTGFLFELAQEFSALIVFAEHVSYEYIASITRVTSQALFLFLTYISICLTAVLRQVTAIW